MAIVGGLGAYLAVLVVVGWRAERAQQPAGGRGPQAGRWLAGLRYGLSLATLCSAWTYFGAVGDASGGSWLFVANAAGPVIAVALAAPVWRRVAVLAKQENVGSLADFLAARHGKSRALGAVVALVAMLGAVPYLALQLTVLNQAWRLVTGVGFSTAVVALVVVVVALAIGFGTRRPSLTQQNPGFVRLVTVEALVKLAGLVAVAALVVLLLATPTPHRHGGFTAAVTALWTYGPPLSLSPALPFATLTLLCTLTAFTLPRQFHLGFVALDRLDAVGPAIRVVPAYFGLWVAATLVIATGIRAGLGAPGISPFLQVLGIPLAAGHAGIALLALVGGLSAGAAMMVVELTAVSAMVSNEIVLPLLAGLGHGPPAARPVGGLILATRRALIVVLALLALGWFAATRATLGPSELGLTALAASAQLAPPLLIGLYWRRGHAHGALAGIGAGMAVWAVAIAGPALLIHPLDRPLFGHRAWTPDRAVLASLALNALLYVVVSLRTAPRLIDRIQATSFVGAPTPASDLARGELAATVGDLRRILVQFIGPDEADLALRQLAFPARLVAEGDHRPVTPTLVRATERVLAGVIGAPSARNVIALALAGGADTGAGADPRDISRLLDEAGQAVHFSRELLQTTLEALPQGICVTDSEARLVAWNRRWLALLGLDGRRPHLGAPLADLLNEAASRGIVPAPARGWVAAATGPAWHEEVRNGERVHALTGLPLAGGDMLLTIADITDLREAERVLAQSNEALERRVAERTSALAAAKARADEATGAQKRFVAAASHDLVQPLHAARLFVGNARLVSSADERDALLARADQAVDGAHRLLRALLKLSELELGAVAPQRARFAVALLLDALAEEFAGLAQARGLDLLVLPSSAWVETDRDLLRSVLQNLIVNALRYTPRGRVVVLARRRGSMVRFEVRDSGIGIDPALVPQAFGAFRRLETGRALAEGTGLGLSIVARIAEVLDHPLDVASRPGAGSLFAIHVPETAPEPVRPVAPAQRIDLGGLRVLCLDDDPDVLAGTAALLQRWGADVTAAAAPAAVPAGATWDVVLADHHLGRESGLAFLRALSPAPRLRLLVTATPASDLDDGGVDDITVLAKPLAPLVLQRVLAEVA